MLPRYPCHPGWNKLKSDFEAELLQTVPDTDILIVKEFELVCKAETLHY